MSYKQLLKESWTAIAHEYKSTLVPRFKPWVEDAVRALSSANPPIGSIFVAGCGTGEELVQLATAFPSHRIVGMDVAEGMIKEAASLVYSYKLQDRIELSVGDATVIPRACGNVTALFSCFALQQMNQPSAVLNSWYERMAAGGILVVCYWPAIIENAGPWRRLIELSNLKGSQAEGWEVHLLDQVIQSGAEVLTDTLIPHTMSWNDAEEFWQVMTESGPWHVRRLKFGDAEMESLKAAFLSGHKKEEPLVHRPFARLLVLKKPLRSSL